MPAQSCLGHCGIAQSLSDAQPGVGRWNIAQRFWFEANRIPEIEWLYAVVDFRICSFLCLRFSLFCHGFAPWFGFRLEPFELRLEMLPDFISLEVPTAQMCASCGPRCGCDVVAADLVTACVCGLTLACVGVHGSKQVRQRSESVCACACGHAGSAMRMRVSAQFSQSSVLDAGNAGMACQRYLYFPGPPLHAAGCGAQ